MSRFIEFIYEHLQILIGLVGKLWTNIASIDSVLSVFALIAGALGAYFGFIRKQIKRRSDPKKEFNRFIDQNYGRENRVLLKKFYVETRGQDIDPCYNDEIREDNGVYFSVPLVPFFINTAFLSTDQAKYYLVLADSGMGKSTFLLRLYHDYLLQPSRKKKNDIKLIPLSKTNCIEAITNIKDKEQTILLLDALDENTDAMTNYEMFFSKLLKATEDFFVLSLHVEHNFFPMSTQNQL